MLLATLALVLFFLQLPSYSNGSCTFKPHVHSAPYYYSVQGASSVPAVNTLYYCEGGGRAGRATRAEVGASDMCRSPDGRFSLSSSFRVAAGGVGARTDRLWFIKETIRGGGEGLEPVTLYGTAEVHEGVDVGHESFTVTHGVWRTNPWKRFDYPDAGADRDGGDAGSTPRRPVLHVEKGMQVTRRGFFDHHRELGPCEVAVATGTEGLIWAASEVGLSMHYDPLVLERCLGDRSNSSADAASVPDATATAVSVLHGVRRCEMLHRTGCDAEEGGGDELVDSWMAAENCYKGLLAGKDANIDVDVTVGTAGEGGVTDDGDVDGAAVDWWSAQAALGCAAGHWKQAQQYDHSRSHLHRRLHSCLVRAARMRLSVLLVTHALDLHGALNVLRGGRAEEPEPGYAGYSTEAVTLIELCNFLLSDYEQSQLLQGALMVRGVDGSLGGTLRQLQQSVHARCSSLVASMTVTMDTTDAGVGRFGVLRDALSHGCHAVGSLLELTKTETGASERDEDAELVLRLQAQQAGLPPLIFSYHNAGATAVAFSTTWHALSRLVLGPKRPPSVGAREGLYALVALAEEAGVGTGAGDADPGEYRLTSLDRLLTGGGGAALALYVSALMQLTSPTLVEAPVGSDRSSTDGLRDWRRCVTAMTSLRDHCALRARPGMRIPRCQFADPVGRVNVRGLFLLAYQGLGLAAGASNGQALQYRDDAIGTLYQQLLRVVSEGLGAGGGGGSEWPWAYEPSSADTLIGTDDTAKDGSNPVAAGNTSVLRVGFVSAFWFRHSVGRLLARVITGLCEGQRGNPSASPATLEVHVLQVIHGRTAAEEDDLTQDLKDAAHQWHRISSDAGSHGIGPAARRIRALSLDVIVFGDVHMDAFTLHLSMLRLAPVAAVFWGHPFTSGQPHAIDYFISSGAFEWHADGRQREVGVDRGLDMFSEQLVQFDSLDFSFYPEIGEGNGETEEVSRWSRDGERLWLEEYLTQHGKTLSNRRFHPRATAATTRGNCTAGLRFYGALQSLMKLHPLFDASVLVPLLLRDACAVVVLQYSDKQTLLHEVYQRRLHAEILHQGEGEHHSSVESRVVFIRQVAHATYRRLLCAMHVSLDPVPFGGGVTLMDSLGGCNVPVPFVTLPTMQTVHALGRGIAWTMAPESAVHLQTGSKRTWVPPTGHWMVAADSELLVAQAVALAVEVQCTSGVSQGTDTGTACSSPSRPRIKLPTRASVRSARDRAGATSVEEWRRFIIASAVHGD